MRSVVAILAFLVCGSASAQDVFFEDSYSTPDLGYGYSTQTYGFGGRLGSPLGSYYIDSYTTPDFGFGRQTSSYGYGYRAFDYGSSFDYSPRYSYGSRRSFMFPSNSRRHRW
jgi:hypothetical protein